MSRGQFLPVFTDLQTARSGRPFIPRVPTHHIIQHIPTAGQELGDFGSFTPQPHFKKYNLYRPRAKKITLFQDICPHLLLRVEFQGLLTAHTWAGVYCCCSTENLSYCVCSLQAKTQQTEGMLMNLSSENLLLIQYQMQRERTYLGQYLYGMKLHPKVI